MDFIRTMDSSGLGSWLLILGYPLASSHHLRDEERQLSGPTFATCTGCIYQAGSCFENRDPDLDWSLGAYPGQLQCNYRDDEDEGEDESHHEGRDGATPPTI